MAIVPQMRKAVRMEGCLDDQSAEIPMAQGYAVNETPVPADGDRVLILTHHSPEAALTQDVLAQAGLDYRRCLDVDELCAAIDHNAGAAIVGEEELDPATVQRLVDVLRHQGTWSDFPLLILFSQVGKTPGVALRMLDLLEPLGNFFILERPASALALGSTVQAALRARRRQFETHALIARHEHMRAQQDRWQRLLAHELRNALGAIRLSTAVLERLGSPTPPFVEQCATLVRQAGRMSGLIDDLLDVTPVLAGELAIQAVPLDLREVTLACVQQMIPEAEARHVRLHYAPISTPVPVLGNRERLTQAVSRLLLSAVHHAAAGFPLRVSLNCTANEAVIELCSDGLKLPRQTVADVLAREVGEEALLERHPEAVLQVRLRLVRSILQWHGGALEAPNEQTLTVRLPLRSVAEAAAPQHAPVAHNQSGRRVLVVEDNPDYRETLRLLVQLWGHQVSVASSGTQGVQRALADRPDVVLIDIGLPGMHGYQVARRLRDAFQDNITLVAMTGFGPPHDRLRAEEAGFDLHMLKPVDPAALRASLTAREPARPK